MSPKVISPSEAYRQRTNQLVLDVRTPAEFEEAHIEGSILHPLTDLDPSYVKELAEGKQSCVVVCRSGNRAKQAGEKLLAGGLTSVHVLDGGLLGWESEGLPVKRGRRTISLERQVRIGAGSLVVVGSLLAYLVSPAWIALPLFVGAGLVFAGVTDTCGMAMVLARMPWNTRREKSSTCGASKSGGCHAS